MPLTASKTDADINAATRVVANGLVPAVSAALFNTSIHSNTGSGVEAVIGLGFGRPGRAKDFRSRLRLFQTALRTLGVGAVPHKSDSRERT